jgi:hypothetical protein
LEFNVPIQLVIDMNMVSKENAIQHMRGWPQCLTYQVLELTDMHRANRHAPKRLPGQAVFMGREQVVGAEAACR